MLNRASVRIGRVSRKQKTDHKPGEAEQMVCTDTAVAEYLKLECGGAPPLN